MTLKPKRKRQHRRKQAPPRPREPDYEEPVSLYPHTPDEVVATLLGVPPKKPEKPQ